MKRDVITIDEDKCIGCEKCIKACHQGAIQIVDGKARMMKDEYCDGLGMCLPDCPTDAIKITQKETIEFNEDRRGYATRDESSPAFVKPAGGGCPGSAARTIKPKEETSCGCSDEDHKLLTTRHENELRQWPVQLHLVHPQADYLENANLLICADCVPFAYANFHSDFIKDHVVVVACPKLDDTSTYVSKITSMISNKNLKSITVLRMEVPCCGGIARMTAEAIQNATNEIPVPYREITIGVDGRILK